MTDLTHPGAVIGRLEDIELDLAARQEGYEQAALAWFRSKRDKEYKRALAFIEAEGSVELRKAIADRETALDGKEDEALWEASKAVVKVLETRATIGMALLKSQGRA